MVSFLQIVEIKERPTNVCEMDYTFYLALVKPSSIDESPNDDAIESDIPKMYFRVQNLIEFDTFAVTHGPGTYVDGNSITKSNAVTTAHLILSIPSQNAR